MSSFNLTFAAVCILLMVGAVVHATITFDNGDELKAIFNIATAAFVTSFWAWLLMMLKDQRFAIHFTVDGAADCDRISGCDEPRMVQTKKGVRIMPKTIGYKGFDKGFKCRGMQYEVGKTYEESEAKICECGLHFCSIPRDVFNYYSPGDNSRYALVETEAEVFGSDDDSKKCTTKLTILKELTLAEMIQETIKIALTNRAAVSSTGHRARVKVEGANSLVCAVGRESAVSGVLGTWITLAEWSVNSEGHYVPKFVKSFKVDGKKVKADTFYKLENKKLVEVD